MIEVKRPVIVYIESTPNPSSMKFVVNKFLLEEGSVEYTAPEQTENSPLAKQLFSFSGVTGVFVTSNFVTVTKAVEADWTELSPILREFIKGYMESGDPVFTGPRIQVADPAIERTTTNSDLENKIIETLEEYVKPAVEQDGGAIHFKSFDEGRVTVVLKGACSGCPSSTITLKAGIENLLKRMIPEVTEVVAEEV